MSLRARDDAIPIDEHCAGVGQTCLTAPSAGGATGDEFHRNMVEACPTTEETPGDSMNSSATLLSLRGQCGICYQLKTSSLNHDAAS
jgi:hypothetical protein